MSYVIRFDGEVYAASKELGFPFGDLAQAHHFPDSRSAQRYLSRYFNEKNQAEATIVPQPTNQERNPK